MVTIDDIKKKWLEYKELHSTHMKILTQQINYETLSSKSSLVHQLRQRISQRHFEDSLMQERTHDYPVGNS